jgi:hypothetical protein
VSETLVVAEEDRGVLNALNADIQASLALSRATLRALAALSPALNSAAEAALEDETERAVERNAPKRTLEIVEDARLRLQQAPAEAELARALQRVLIDAAEALPHRASRAA